MAVDVAHNTIEGSSGIQKLSLEQPNESWSEYYGSGNNYLIAVVGGKAARWIPHLARGGNYRIAIKYYATSRSSGATYDIRDPADKSIGGFSLNQYSAQDGWRTAVLGPIWLNIGASLKAWAVPKNTTVGAVKFIYVP